jgi:hypothetical protein
LRLVKPYRDGGPALNEWEIPGLKTAIHIDGTLNDSTDEDRGWSVEMALPWEVLAEFANRPTPPRDGDQWRINFSRVEWDIEIIAGQYNKIPGRPEYNWVWSPQDVIDMHRPETWGYVQFSTATVGHTAFAPDPTAPARNLLMQIYLAQRSYQKQHGRWTETLADLALPALLSASPKLRLTPAGYTASVVVPSDGRPGETSVQVHVSQDSRLWVTE